MIYEPLQHFPRTGEVDAQGLPCDAGVLEEFHDRYFYALYCAGGALVAPRIWQKGRVVWFTWYEHEGPEVLRDRENEVRVLLAEYRVKHDVRYLPPHGEIHVAVMVARVVD